MGDNIKNKKRKQPEKSFHWKTKMKMIRRLDSGERQSQISAALNLTTSTISS